MLREAGACQGAELEVMVAEKVWRERKPADYMGDVTNHHTPIERRGLMVMGDQWKERTDR